MFIDQITNSGAIGTLEVMVQFAAQRHEVLAHNIANISTPGFRNRDVSVRDFQEALSKAMDQRGEGGKGPLSLESTEEIEFGPSGRVTLHPRTPSGGILFHDRNDRDLERMMQGLAENTAMHRVASDLLRSRYDIIRAATREVA